MANQLLYARYLHALLSLFLSLPLSLSLYHSRSKTNVHYTGLYDFLWFSEAIVNSRNVHTHTFFRFHLTHSFVHARCIHTLRKDIIYTYIHIHSYQIHVLSLSLVFAYLGAWCASLSWNFKRANAHTMVIRLRIFFISHGTFESLIVDVYDRTAFDAKMAQVYLVWHWYIILSRVKGIFRCYCVWRNFF